MRLGEMLIEAGLVDENQIAAATARRGGLRLGSALILDRAVDPEVVNRTLAQQQGLPALKLSDLDHPDPAARALIPEVLARRLHAVGLAVTGTGKSRTLLVAMRDPGDLAAVDELTFAVGMKLDIRIAPDVYLRDALERAALAPATTARSPSSDQLAAAAPASGPGPRPADLDLGIDPAAPARRGRAPSPQPYAPTLPAPAALIAPPPDPYATSGASKVLGLLIKLAIAAAAVVSGVYLYRTCLTTNTRAVGTHWASKELGLAIDFPDSGWRTAPGMGKKVINGARAEYFYRGNAPELPVVGLVLVRGQKSEVADAAETLLGEVVRNVREGTCKESYARPGAYMCSGFGTVGLFGKAMEGAEVEVHAWSDGTDVITAAMIKPDHTLSETEMILGSITDL